MNGTIWTSSTTMISAAPAVEAEPGHGQRAEEADDQRAATDERGDDQAVTA